MAYRDKIAEAERLNNEAMGLLEKEGAGQEDIDRAQKLMADAKLAQAAALNLKQIQEMASSLQDGLANGRSGGAVTPYGQKAGLYRPSGEWNGFPDFIRSVHRAGNLKTGTVDKRLVYMEEKGEEPTELKDLAEGVGASGGFLVPPDYRAEILAVAGESAIVRNRATIIPMARRQVNIPAVDQTATTAGIPHWFGGMQAFWTAEAGAFSSSDAQFRQVELVAYKLVGFTRTSDELLDDSAIALAAFLSGPLGFPGLINWVEDFVFLQGDGVGKPQGILNAASAITVNRSGGASTITVPDIATMFAKMMPTSKPVWIANISTLPQLIQLNGPSGNPSYVWVSLADGLPASMMGYPIIFTEKTPALNSKGDLMLVDLSYYLIGDRQATTIESTRLEKWTNDQTSWRAIHRVAGRPWPSAAFTLQDGATTVSPFVLLGP